MKIGVFDSGVGGKSVAQAVRLALPENEVVFRYDAEHFPYAKRTPEELIGFVTPILQSLIDEGCQVIIIACNTVSTTIVSTLRERFSVPLIALEPMIKPAAALTKTGVIAICATPTTLASERYHWLKQTYAPDVQVIEPDCSDWSYLIEHNLIDEAKISDRLQVALDADADVIVLGCTHYHWIEEDIQQLCAGRAIVIQPEQAVIRQLQRVLARLG